MQRHYVACKRRDCKPEAQRMTDLPSDRTTPENPPFTCVGADCLGPFYVKCGRAQEKRHGASFPV